MKKIILTIVVMLLISLCVLTTQASDPLPLKKSIYVNDDNTQGPWLGTQDNPYRYIQDAIDNAVADDIIYVANGTYYEHLIIYSHLNGLTIQHWTDAPGENDNIPPTLNGNSTGTGISIFSSKVKITQLSITDYGSGGRDAGIYIEYDANRAQIINNIIIDSYHGIWIKRDRQADTLHIIQDNVISNIAQRGISIILGDNNQIVGNTLSNCYWGICLHDSYKNFISENLFINNEHGLVIDMGMENRIENNEFKQNEYGLALIGTRSTTIRKNNFIDNTKSDAYIITYSFVNADVWSENYWGRRLFSPIVIIPGTLRLAKIDIPWVKLEFFPASQPN
ncbi:MAG: right-handed parallel beta-helix repeat-containing protein [Thermoplasmatota archaeon]